MGQVSLDFLLLAVWAIHAYLHYLGTGHQTLGVEG